jgi:probable rRNA maturation factor
MKKGIRIEIYEKQKKVKIDHAFLWEKIEVLKRVIKMPLKKVFVYLVNNRTIKKLNKDFLNQNTPTDVLAFKYPDGSGEIIISVEECKKNADIYSNTIEKEVIYVLIHGILHLNGYRDYLPKERDEMFKIQNEIFKMVMKNEEKEKLYIT